MQRKSDELLSSKDGWQGGGPAVQCHIFAMVLAINPVTQGGCKNTANNNNYQYAIVFHDRPKLPICIGCNLPLAATHFKSTV